MLKDLTKKRTGILEKQEKVTLALGIYTLYVNEVKMTQIASYYGISLRYANQLKKKIADF